MAPRLPVPLREIVYSLSPYQQSVITQTFKHAPGSISHLIAEKWHGAVLTVGVLGGTLWYCSEYKEQEKLSHRF